MSWRQQNLKMHSKLVGAVLELMHGNNILMLILQIIIIEVNLLIYISTFREWASKESQRPTNVSNVVIVGQYREVQTLSHDGRAHREE